MKEDEYEYTQTTGKAYTMKKSVKCVGCGEVYYEEDNKACPKCKSTKAVAYQQTTARLPKEE